MELTREQALTLLQKYNKEAFHIQHALTVEGVIRWFARENGEDADFWGQYASSSRVRMPCRSPRSRTAP